MNQCNAQGNESQGVAFFIVEINYISLPHLAKEIQQYDGEIGSRQDVSQHHRARFYGEEYDSEKNDCSHGKTDYLRKLLGIVERLQIDEKEERCPVFVDKKQSRGQYEIQDTKQIELYHSQILQSYLLSINQQFGLKNTADYANIRI